MKMITQTLIKHIPLLLVLLISMPFQSKAHEEPSKTLKEKREKTQKKQKIYNSKIKTITVWKYVFENNAETSVRQKAFVMGYDCEGNYTSIEAYKNDSLNVRVEYAYSKQGDMLSDTDFSPEGKMVEKNTYTYDKDGRVISGVSTAQKDSLTGYFKIAASTNKKSLDFISYYTGDSLEYKITYKYPGDYDHYDYQEACKYDAKGKLTLKVEKTYDTGGQVIRKKVFDGEQKLTFYFIYEYDKAENNTQIAKLSPTDEIIWQDFYTFDKMGNTLDMKSYDKEKNLTARLVYEYEYYK
jgi:hypothetical protein